jgi:hypothetical protein
MSRSSARGLVEPVPALVAVVVVVLALALYVGVLDDVLPESRDRRTVSHVADRIEANASTAGVVRPGRLSNTTGVVPDGYEANVTLVTDDRRWTAGATPPSAADAATRLVSVDRGPGVVRPGRLTVVVW